jgi:hypothetical protein
MGQIDFPEALEAIRGQGMFLANVPNQIQCLGVEVVGFRIQ